MSFGASTRGRASTIIICVGLVLLGVGYLLSNAALALVPGLLVIVVGFLWPRITRAAEASIRAEIERLRVERDQLMAEVEASGKPLMMSDEQYTKMKVLAEAAGPEAMERFRKMAKAAGRVA